ncbi:aldo/keto reductase [Mycolicibacter longobardus]|uniref:Aldo/keto reductase n=1 Tax=Mycolicibacter longobardus TaxID=1108812 RepID=A0A1X1YKG3_9MYCO|nr:aldo/keto reductase [Mycolicibacter longobardus]MCV7383906.1 aldo/keto reductase [Mycolicibacter longobardus]ORW11515.1 aldo/keto reductase [Mycolicibacter longobardus]
MEYTTLGSTGVQVSPLCFGAMSFGAEADDQSSAEMYRRVRDAGINFFDSADVYSGGASEEILGRLIKDERDEVVITSKVFYPTGTGPNAAGLSRRHISLAVDASLRRFRTDWIDVYFVHAFDENTPIEETLRALDQAQRAGKILYLGVSNWAAWQIALALGVSAREGLARFQVIEPMYNLVRRQAEVEILPLAAAQQLGVITYSPLGGGLLTGKYTSTAKPASGRLVDVPRYTDRFGLDSDFATAERFTALAADLDVTPPALAVAWVMANPAVTAPIIGARNLDQLEGSLAALDITMTEELYRRVTDLSTTPAPATDRTETLKPGWA